MTNNQTKGARPVAARHPDADTQKVLAHLNKRYEIEKGRGGHYKIVDTKTGETVLRDDGSPITIASTSSDRNGAQALERELKKYKLLNGRVFTPVRTQREHGRRPELGENREEVKARQRDDKIKSDALRKDIEPWIKKLGGWELRGVKSDIAAVLADLNPDIYKAPINAQSMLTYFSRGDAVTEMHRKALHALNEMFQAADDSRGLYVDLVRKAKGLTSSLGPVKLKPGQEWPYTVKLLRLTDLFADFSYQRPIHEPFVRQLVLTFDERLVGVIDVSARGDGSYAILDGQQRTETMRQRGKTSAYCAVYEDMTVGDEAAYFFHKNKDRKGMSAFFGFRANVLAGDAESIAIEKILKAGGYRVGPTTDQNETIGAVKAVQDVYRMESPVRENCLPPTLEVMRRSWLGRKGSTDTELIRGLGRFFRVYRDDEIQWDHWIEALTALGPVLIIGRARDFSGATEQRYHGKSMASTLVEIHNTGLPSNQRLSVKRLDDNDTSRRARPKGSTV